MHHLVESASLAMVREFLAKRRYRKTLDMLSSELPCKPEPTTTSAVARQLGLTRLLQHNSRAERPLATLLEMLAAHLLHKMHGTAALGSSSPPAADASPTAAVSTTQSAAAAASPPVSRPAFAAPTDSKRRSASLAAVASPPAASMPITASISLATAPTAQPAPPPAASSAARPAVAVSASALTPAAFSAASLSALGKLSLPDRAKAASLTREKKDQHEEEKEAQRGRVLRSAGDGELQMEDVDDDLQRMSGGVRPALSRSTAAAASASPAVFSPASSSVSAFGSSSHFPSSGVSAAEASSLRRVLFGPPSATNNQTFPPSWRSQSFFFSAQPSLPYGLVQKEGGPCGLIASVQAELLRHLLFSPSQADRALRDVTESDRQSALFTALSSMLWRAGGSRRVRLVTTASLTARSVTEGLTVVELDSLSSVQLCLQQHRSAFCGESGCGLLLLLFSLVLSRGLSQCSEDFDQPECSLIGRHHYCTQEMVNLCLTGRACSNVFDGSQAMDGGVVLKGIADSQTDCGLLSLFEHYGYIEVGAALKSPRYPIWLICSESHYTVLFATSTRQISTRSFELFYYDELIQQQEEIRLTVDLTHAEDALRSKDLEPPLNDCIRTKWGKAARIDWNGTEPIL